MIQVSTGIVIKQYTSRQHNITLLDKIYGSIEGVVFTNTLSTGSVINYSMQKRKEAYWLSDITLIHMPLTFAKKDLLFLHHVLEICYFFAPIGSCVAGIFELLLFLYTTEDMWNHMTAKKIFLVKLLSTLGIYPEIQPARTSCVSRVLVLGIYSISNYKIDLADEKELDHWLWCCIIQHPYVQKFKTIQFLTEHRVP